MKRDGPNYSLPIEEVLEALPPLISVGEAARLGIASRRTIRRLCKCGALEATKVNGCWRIVRESLRESIWAEKVS
jgi:excisionase family DNA binding protein